MFDKREDVSSLIIDPAFPGTLKIPIYLIPSAKLVKSRARLRTAAAAAAAAAVPGELNHRRVSKTTSMTTKKASLEVVK